ncbi:dimethyladenosine transferase 2, mitochondrial [Dendropsophus ebraccatus]|uniref:dimethyladenosine transferase 2, mitochondrial n=1 Tax=Dendropsophus ebraccatus TaxID=150705 RepID=UPI0038322EA7
MSAIWAARTALYIARCGPQAWTPDYLCSRLTPNVSVPSCPSSTASSLQCPSPASSLQCPSPASSLQCPSPASQEKEKRQSATSNRDDLKIVESCKRFRRFIADPALIDSVVRCLAPWGSGRTPIIMDCNPGPGLLTQALLEAGHKVFALESNLDFLPRLQTLQRKANGQLKVLHCDFFRIDPWSEGIVQPPSMYSTTLMRTLNITEVPWASDVPLKVFLMFGHKNERVLLWRQIYCLYQRLNVYRFGRIELNVFLTETEYLKLISRPGDFMKYRALGVLFQVACHIELLHREPMSSFLTPSRFKGAAATKSGGFADNTLCLVRITPRRNLFSENFTPAEGNIFVYMIKQFMTRRKSKLIEKLDNLAPGSGEDLLRSLALPTDIATGCIHPEEYKLLFETLLRSEEFNRSFVLDEICEKIAATSY